jgi:Flp pilus assembly protein TadG
MKHFKRSASLQKKRHKRRGTILVVAVLFLAIAFAFLAFASDTGRMTTTLAELQNAADAAATAGARALAESPAQARVAANNLASANFAARDSVTLVADQDIDIGTWNEDTATFTVLTGADEEDGDAVRVICRRTAARGNPLDLHFGNFVGMDNADLEVFAVARLTPKICGAFIGIDFADVNSYTDSYKSSNGSYFSQAKGDEGDVCSDGPISISNGTVNGDASPGIGYDVTLSGQGSVTGSTRTHAPRDYPPIDIGDADTNNENHLIAAEYWKSDGGLSLSSSDSVTFPGGILYIETGLSINGELRLAGPTTIYIRQDMQIAGIGIVNGSQIPSDLKIYMLGEGSAPVARVSGSGDFYGIVYAPNSSLRIMGGAHYFGSAIGRELIVSTNSAGTGIHYDESIEQVHEDLVTAKLVQ